VNGFYHRDYGPEQESNGGGSVLNDVDLVAFAPFDEIAEGFDGTVKSFYDQDEHCGRYNDETVEPPAQNETRRPNDCRQEEFAGKTEIGAHRVKKK
jgi:hypothetical protein